jgi:type II secretory pathway pseudopilin PulG
MSSLHVKRNTRGVTLIESVVAVVVLGLILIGLLPLTVGTVLLRQQQQAIAEATSIAQVQLEETRRYWNIQNIATGLPHSGGQPFPVNYESQTFPLFGETLSTCVPKTITLPATTFQITDKGIDGTSTVYNETTTPQLYDTTNLSPNSPNIQGLVNVNAVLPTDARVFSYGLVENLVAQSSTTSGLCNYINSSSSANNQDATNTDIKLRRQVRFVAQIYYGPAPGSQIADINADGIFNTTNDKVGGNYLYNTFRVVVRIYKARKSTTLNCRGTGAGGALTNGQLTACLYPNPVADTLKRGGVFTTDASSLSTLSLNAPLVVLWTDIPFNSTL